MENEHKMENRDYTQLKVEELFKEFEIGFNRMESDKMEKVQQEFKNRNLDFWKMYENYVMKRNVLEMF